MKTLIAYTFFVLVLLVAFGAVFAQEPDPSDSTSSEEETLVEKDEMEQAIEAQEKALQELKQKYQEQKGKKSRAKENGKQEQKDEEIIVDQKSQKKALTVWQKRRSVGDAEKYLKVFSSASMVFGEISQYHLQSVWSQEYYLVGVRYDGYDEFFSDFSFVTPIVGANYLFELNEKNFLLPYLLVGPSFGNEVAYLIEVGAKGFVFNGNLLGSFYVNYSSGGLNEGKVHAEVSAKVPDRYLKLPLYGDFGIEYMRIPAVETYIPVIIGMSWRQVVFKHQYVCISADFMIAKDFGGFMPRVEYAF